MYVFLLLNAKIVEHGEVLPPTEQESSHNDGTNDDHAHELVGMGQSISFVDYIYISEQSELVITNPTPDYFIQSGPSHACSLSEAINVLLTNNGLSTVMVADTENIDMV